MDRPHRTGRRHAVRSHPYAAFCPFFSFPFLVSCGRFSSVRVSCSGVRIGCTVLFGARAACCPREFRASVYSFLRLQVIRMCADARSFVFGTWFCAFAPARSCGVRGRSTSRRVARRSRGGFAPWFSGASDSTLSGLRGYPAASASRRDVAGQLAGRAAGRWWD